MTFKMRSILAVLFLKILYTAIGQSMTCSDPGTPANGRRSDPTKMQFRSLDTVHFYCNNNFNLSGSPKIQCQSGRWSSKIPKCLDICGNACKNGGTCQSDKTCLCPIHIGGVHCQYKLCISPPTIIHGQYKTVRSFGKRKSNYYMPGSQLIVNCDPGYKLQPLGTGSISCYDTGDWSNGNNWPKCQEKRCVNKFRDTDHPFPNGHYQPVRDDYSAGETVHFTCDRGYILEGVSSPRCLENGYWTSNLWPTCRAKSCLNAPAIVHGTTIQDSDSRTVGTKIHFTCRVSQGYYLYPYYGRTQTCQIDSNGDMKWLPLPRPQCISRAQFEKYCILENNGQKVMIIDSEGEARCGFKRTDIDGGYLVTKQNTSIDTLTIVTGTAGGLLGFLLVIIAFVACQRRRLVRRMRRTTSRRPRSWASEEDRTAFLYFSNDFHFFLPSYDEAMRSRPVEPPPFDDAVSNNAETSAEQPASPNNEGAAVDSSATVQDPELPEENAYESIDEVTTLHETTEPNSPSPTNPMESIYTSVQRRAQSVVPQTEDNDLAETETRDISVNRDSGENGNSNRASVSSAEEIADDENQPLIN